MAMSFEFKYISWCNRHIIPYVISSNNFWLELKMQYNKSLSVFGNAVCTLRRKDQEAAFLLFVIGVPKHRSVAASIAMGCFFEETDPWENADIYIKWSSAANLRIFGLSMLLVLLFLKMIIRNYKYYGFHRMMRIKMLMSRRMLGFLIYHFKSNWSAIIC